DTSISGGSSPRYFQAVAEEAAAGMTEIHEQHLPKNSRKFIHGDEWLRIIYHCIFLAFALLFSRRLSKGVKSANL
ncbi:MAG: hypothetical protein IJR35_07775, partial [Synergistaceae bacterium]|nr:hypothetical protein [Synergistaceae bacterium]